MSDSLRNENASDGDKDYQRHPPPNVSPQGQAPRNWGTSPSGSTRPHDGTRPRHDGSKRAGEVARCRVAVGRHLGERTFQYFLNAFGHGGAHNLNRWNWLGPMFRDDGLRGWRIKWGLARYHLVHDASKGVHVASTIDDRIATRLLWTHIERRTQHDSAFREAFDVVLTQCARYSKISEEGMVRVEQHILWFDVAMQHTVGMREVECGGQFARNLEHDIERQGAR
jgi:hypothetical protein